MQKICVIGCKSAPTESDNINKMCIIDKTVGGVAEPPSYESELVPSTEFADAKESDLGQAAEGKTFYVRTSSEEKEICRQWELNWS